MKSTLPVFIHIPILLLLTLLQRYASKRQNCLRSQLPLPTLALQVQCSFQTHRTVLAPLGQVMTTYFEIVLLSEFPRFFGAAIFSSFGGVELVLSYPGS